jgi:hypothetical protein
LPSSSPLLGVTGSVSTTDGAAKAAGSTTRPLAGWTTLNYDPKTNTAWYGSLHLNNRYLTSASARRRPPATSSATPSASATAGRVEAVPPACDAARVAGEESA